MQSVRRAQADERQPPQAPRTAIPPSRKGICILRIVCYLFFLFIRIAPLFFQYSQYWKWPVYCAINDSLPDSYFFPRTSCFPLFYRFGSTFVNDSFLFSRIDFPFRSFLPNGVNALVLESGTLYSSGSSCNTCFCTIKFNGSKYGRYTTRIYYFMDSSTRLFYIKYMGIPKKASEKSTSLSK